MLAGAPNPADAWTLIHLHAVNVTTGCDIDDSGYGVAVSGWPCNVGVKGRIRRRYRVSSTPLHPGASLWAYAADNGMLAASPQPPVFFASALSDALQAPLFGFPVTMDNRSSAATALPPVAPRAWASPPYDTLAAKSAAIGGPDFVRPVFQAAKAKVEANVMRRVWTAEPVSFAQYADFVLPGLPVPTLVHPIGYMPGGHDSNYPVYLPPDPRFDTACQLRDFVLRAHAAGHLTLPYSNPSWWPMNGSAIAGWPLERIAAEVAVLDAVGAPRTECYASGAALRCGYVASLRSPYVQAVVQQSLVNVSWNATPAVFAPGGAAAALAAVPCETATARIPSTFVYEDQLGARGPLRDFSQWNSGRGEAGYAQAVYAHVANYSRLGLHTEFGVDRHVRFHYGLHGHNIPTSLPGDVYTVRPLTGYAFRAHALTYRYYFTTAQMVPTPEHICLGASLGLQLAFDISDMRYHPQNYSWVAAIGQFQRQVMARYADAYVQADAMLFVDGSAGDGATAASGAGQLARIISFRTSSAGVYTALWNAFPNATGAPLLLRSRSSDGASPARPFDIAPLGCVVAGASAGDVFAGFFSGAYNGRPLAPGLHLIIETHGDGLPYSEPCAMPAGVPVQAAGGGGGGAGTPPICIFHPYGQPTNLSVAVPSGAVVRAVVGVNTAWQPLAYLPFAVSWDAGGPSPTAPASASSPSPSASAAALVTFLCVNTSFNNVSYTEKFAYAGYVLLLDAAPSPSLVSSPSLSPSYLPSHSPSALPAASTGGTLPAFASASLGATCTSASHSEAVSASPAASSGGGSGINEGGGSQSLSTSSTSSTPAPALQSHDGHAVPTGSQLLGVVVGVLLPLIALAACAVLLLRRYRSRAHSTRRLISASPAVTVVGAAADGGGGRPVSGSFTVHACLNPVGEGRGQSLERRV